MSKNMKQGKWVLFLLLAAMILSATACGSTESTETGAETIPTETTAAETEETRLTDDLPDLDFEGRSFMVLAGLENWYKGYIDVEETTGDVLNDAIYDANRALEERFHVVIEQTTMNSGEAYTTGKELMMAGEHYYDIISFVDRNALSSAVEGMLLPYDEMPYINLDKAYWCQGINQSISIGNKNYLAYGDFNMTVYDYTHLLSFNWDMINDFGLENPYVLVDEGRWTYDTMSEMFSVVTSDLNGDGVMDEEDRYGLSSGTKTYLPSMWIGANVHPITKDEDDLLVFTAPGDTQFAEVYQSLFDIFWKGSQSMPFCTTTGGFAENRTLFNSSSFHSFSGDSMRDIEFDFGIIPYPKYTESQSQYYSRVEGGQIFVIPITTTDSEFTGAMLEAMSASAHNNIIPAYFEISLKVKYVRDNDSARMFDVVMDSRVYDLADTFWCSQIRDGFLGKLFADGNDALASALAANQKSIDASIAKTVEALVK